MFRASLSNHSLFIWMNETGEEGCLQQLGKFYLSFLVCMLVLLGLVTYVQLYSATLCKAASRLGLSGLLRFRFARGIQRQHTFRLRVSTKYPVQYALFCRKEIRQRRVDIVSLPGILYPFPFLPCPWHILRINVQHIYLAEKKLCVRVVFFLSIICCGRVPTSFPPPPPFQLTTHFPCVPPLPLYLSMHINILVH